MNLTYEEAITKVQKLLRLATSSNVNEAALAAAKAQEIMDAYEIQEAVLATSTGPENPDSEEDKDPFIDYGRMGDALDPTNTVWRTSLACGLAEVNICKIYTSSGRGIQIIGRPKNVQTIRYMYGFIIHQINKLADEHKGFSRTWKNNFRLGAVHTINARLKEQKKATQTTWVQDNKHLPAVVVNKTLARLQQNKVDLANWVQQNTRLRPGYRRHMRNDPTAYQYGIRAGHSVNLGGGARAAIGITRKAVE